MELSETLYSQLDKSVNFIFKGSFPGYFEARYVRRSEDYFICYLSSQSGCNQACQQCHLTQTKQTKFINATDSIYLEQAKVVFEYYKKQKGPKAQKVHFSFMVRGEPLDNPFLLGDGKQHRNLVIDKLSELAYEHEVYPRFCISTIMPKTLPHNIDLALYFGSQPVDLYYSIYSTNEKWKQKWMPQALPVENALDILANYQHKTRKIIKLHWPFIKDENDLMLNTASICEEVKKRKLHVDINIVRYNPFSEDLGEESPEPVVERNVGIIKDMLGFQSKVKVIPRVGKDIYASCGMFLNV